MISYDFTIFKQQTQHFQMSVASCQMRCSVICVECGLVGFHSCLEHSLKFGSGSIWMDLVWDGFSRHCKKG